MAPEAANTDVTVKQQTRAASLAGINRALAAGIRWVEAEWTLRIKRRE